MVYSWDSIPQTAHKTGLFLHKFWNEFPENGCDEEIDSISLHLLQNRIKFTVCKFVELNWSLIHLIIQTTAMYLVWLIQLKS
ncbi:hypothetical protein Zmor_025373 [Zophobas morio]|uniref:Uncharacterized protein n=1 Tax=Zophobas morio TaxID=2755281 RepID=A0AA38M4I9_9CUCU|nr:hypothetical protein Zmor_025373 [Zophobas morio]